MYIYICVCVCVCLYHLQLSDFLLEKTTVLIYTTWELLQYRVAPETLLIIKSRETSVVHNPSFGYTKSPDSDTIVFYIKFQNDWATEIDIMDKRDFARFEFEVSFGGMSHMATAALLGWEAYLTWMKLLKMMT